MFRFYRIERFFEAGRKNVDLYSSIGVAYGALFAFWALVYGNTLRLRKKLRLANENHTYADELFDRAKMDRLGLRIGLWENVGIMLLSIMAFPVLFIGAFIPLAAFSMADATAAGLFSLIFAAAISMATLLLSLMKFFSILWSLVGRLDAEHCPI